jgi:uncharacterized membrane protein
MNPRPPHPRSATGRCAVCGRVFPIGELVPLALVRHAVAEAIHAEHPEITEGDILCSADLQRYRTRYIQDVLESDRGEISDLERQVLESLEQHETLTRDVEGQFASDRSLGERLADRVASFGGSWVFIGTFFGALLIWIAINSIQALGQPFDPYPFILLNLLLSCLAAIQAPIIMMSQNRQEAKDRLRAQEDYRVNLKAELEIRHLHSKLDLLLTHQWQRLLEIQELQTEMLGEISQRGERRGAPE